MSDDKSDVVIPKGWKSGSLGEFCEMYQPRTISTKELIDDGDYPVYGANGQIGFYNLFNHEDSEVTVTCRGATCGTVNVIPAKSWITGNAMVVRPLDNCMSKELLHYLLNSLDFTNVITGTAQPQITRTTLTKTQIVVPAPKEQKQIVEILEEQLSRLDSALDSVRVVREKAVRFRRSLLHAAFTGLLTSHDTLPGELPEGWVQKQLVDVCLKVSKVDPLELNRETFKYVDIGSIESETNSVESPQVLSVKDAPGRARQLLHQGDSVFSTVRPYLKNIAYINDALDGEIASTGFCVIRPNPKLVSACLLKFFVISDNLLDQILPLQRGVSYPAVRDREVLSALINLPPPAEQQKIVEILEEQLSRLNGSLAIADVIEKKASALRRSLLHAAFTGELTKEWREGIYV